MQLRSLGRSSLRVAPVCLGGNVSSATTVGQLNDLVAATQLKLDRADVEQLNSASA
jgi:aryl-alcohol dehydrogenase-like predicted oxidoreductase